MKSRTVALMMGALGLGGTAYGSPPNPPTPFPIPSLEDHPDTPPTDKAVYYVQFHFSAVAWNHPVKSVKFHANVQFTDHCHHVSEVKVRDRNGHVAEMKRKDGYFNARCIITAMNDGCRQIEHPIVQYEILFEDGTTYLTPVEEIPTSTAYLGRRYQSIEASSAPNALAEAKRELHDAPDAHATEVSRYVWIPYSPPPPGPQFPR
jgi:hypothetical protein